MQLLVERVDVRIDGVDVWLRPTDSPGWCGKWWAAGGRRREAGDGLGGRRDDHRPHPDLVQEAQDDAAALVLLASSPIFFFFLFKPTVLLMSRQRRLTQSRERLCPVRGWQRTMKRVVSVAGGPGIDTAVEPADRPGPPWGPHGSTGPCG